MMVQMSLIQTFLSPRVAEHRSTRVLNRWRPRKTRSRTGPPRPSSGRMPTRCWRPRSTRWTRRPTRPRGSTHRPGRGSVNTGGTRYTVNKWSVCVAVSVFVCLSVCFSVSVSLSVFVSVYEKHVMNCWSVCGSVSVFICLSVSFSVSHLSPSLFLSV